MKKAFIPFLVAGMLSTTSCTELFEPTVDYGDQTYINDYSALVAAVNDLNKSTGERFEALNKLLNKNMADIKLSIDGNTGAINAIGENMEDGFSAINTTLFNGFSALGKQIDETGKQLVYAINENGELLRLEIDKTGKLISAQIEESANKLVATINSLTATLEEKFDALTLITKAGFAEVSVKIDKLDKTLDVQLTDVNNNLGTLNTTMFNGFKALNTTIDANGNKLVTAMNENGELLCLKIDETGKLISAEIKKSADALVAVINSQTATLEEKFNALNGMITAGFANVSTQIGKVGEQLHLDIQDIHADLGTLNTTMAEGFTTLSTKIDANGNTIATAINAQGEKLEIAIGKNGEVISAKIKDFQDAYATAEAAELAKMAEVVGAINDLTKANNENSANLINKLEQWLTDKGIYYDENNHEQMYMTPENFAKIQDAGPTSNVYKLYADKLDVLTVTFTSKQVVDAAGNTHPHAIFTPNTAADASPVLVASKAEVVNGIANGKEVVRVVKTAVDRNYTVTIQSGCNSPYMFALRLTDANGTNDYTFTPTTSHSFKLLVYNATTGIISNNINAIVYCIPTSNTSTYPLVNPIN